jgi:hypothetical protein
MPTLFEIFNVLDPEAEIEIFDNKGYLLYEGTKDTIELTDEYLLNAVVRLLLTGIVTKIFLEVYDA